MSDKKGLSAFINKNKKSKKPKAKEGETNQKEVDQAEDAQVATKNEEVKKNTPVQNESSDEEVDELEIANKQIDNANIKENKDVGAVGDDKKKGFGYDDVEARQIEAQKREKQAGKKFGDGAMSFSRPTFTKNNKKIGNRGDFDAGLDDLEDDGQPKKDWRNKPSGGDGQREFVNLGSTARTGELREESKREAVKPTFKGRMNLAKTGTQPDEENQGVVKSYDFRASVYKGDNDNEERRFNNGEEGQSRGGRGGRGRRGGRGENFGDRKDEPEDEGFQMITGLKRKTRKNPGDSSSEDEDQGGSRGGFSRGGFSRGGFSRGGDSGFSRGGDSGFSRGGDSGFSRGGRGRREEGGGFISRNTEGDSEQIRGARVERGGNRGGRGGFD